MRVIVAGAGITGLAAAHDLARSGAQVEVLDASDSPGGKVSTERTDGFLIENGPDSFISYRPAATALAHELGLGAEIIGTREPRRVMIRTGGRFVPMPDGMGLVLPTRLVPFMMTRLFSPLEKLRMGLDLVLPRSDDETDVPIGQFLRRRLGPALVERLGDPLIGGIYGASVDDLSLDSVVPQLRTAEREHRSLLLASLAQGRARGRAPGAPAQAEAERRASGQPASNGSPFLSLAGGMGSLVDALVARLDGHAGARLRLGTSIARLERVGSRIVVRLADGSSRTADAVILAVPARAAARALATEAPDAAAALALIPHGSTAVVTLAYRSSQLPAETGCHGFLVARDEPLGFGACTWSAAKWPGRAPDGWVLARVFIGERSSACLGLSDEDAAAMAHRDLARVAGIRGDPAFHRVTRWRHAMPRYEVGHRDRVASVEAALARLPGVEIAGAALRGVGVPDCIEQGRAAATRVLERLSGSMSMSAAAS